MLSAILTTAQDVQQQAKGTSVWFWVIYIGLMLGLIYLMIVKPQKKAKKAQEDLHKSMEPGDTVMTTGGFYGTLLDIIDDQTVIVEFGNDRHCRIPMHPNAIAEVEKAGSAVMKADEQEEEKDEPEEEKKLGTSKM